MTGTRHYKIVIFVGIVIVALMAAALFSVSFAKWQGGTTSVSTSGTVGQFYVDYDFADMPTVGFKTKAVRRSAGQTTGSGTTFTYHNYVCVKRIIDDEHPNNVGEAICFVDFSVLGADGNALSKDASNVEVTSFTVTRTNTDNIGNPTESQPGSTGMMFPRIYNMPSTLGDINRVEHANTNVGTGENDKYYTGGTYISLFFGADKEQYYALDISFTTTESVSFTFLAEASNWDFRNRYKQGWGEPFGFYLGGRINNVNNWDPRYSLKMSGTNISTGKEATSYKKADGSTYYKYTDPIMSEITNVTNTTDTTNYDYGAKFQYPTYIDMSLSINLTSDSAVKLYMLDDSGRREQKTTVNGNVKGLDSTVYFIPKQIVYSNGLDGVSFVADSNGNFNFDIKLPKDGEYTFHYVGNVSYKLSGTSASTAETNNRLHKTGTNVVGASYTTRTYDVKSVETTGYGYIQNHNCLIDKLIITYKEQTANSNVVSFVNQTGKGGVIADPDVSVAQGEKVPKPINEGTTVDGYKLVGYYTDRECTAGNEFDFNTSIRQDTIIYVQWEAAVPTSPIAYSYDGGEQITILKMATQSDSTVTQYSVTGLNVEPFKTIEFYINGTKTAMQALSDNASWYTAYNTGAYLHSDDKMTFTTLAKGKYDLYLKNSNKYPNQWCLYAGFNIIEDPRNMTYVPNNTDDLMFLVGRFSENGIYTDDYGYKMSPDNGQYILENIDLPKGAKVRIRKDNNYYANVNEESLSYNSDCIGNGGKETNSTINVYRDGRYSFYCKSADIYIKFTPAVLKGGDIAVDATNSSNTNSENGDFIIVGSINSWNSAKGFKLTKTTKEDGKTIYIATLKLAANSEIKLKKAESDWSNGNWGNGCAIKDSGVGNNGDNIKIEATGYYRFYLDVDKGKVRIINLGTTPPANL